MRLVAGVATACLLVPLLAGPSRAEGTTSVAPTRAETYGISSKYWKKLTGRAAAPIVKAASYGDGRPTYCFDVWQNRQNSAYAYLVQKGYNLNTPECDPVSEPSYNEVLVRKAGGWTPVGRRDALWIDCSHIIGKVPYTILHQLSCQGAAEVKVSFAKKLTIKGYPTCGPTYRSFSSPAWYFRGCSDESGRYGTWGMWKVTKGKVVERTGLFSRAMNAPDCGASTIKAPKAVKADLYFMIVEVYHPSDTPRILDCAWAADSR